MPVDWGMIRRREDEMKKRRELADYRLGEIERLLSGVYNSGLPSGLLNRIRQGYMTNLNQQTNAAGESIKENIAGSGLRNSGVLSALLTNLYGQKARATTQFESNLAAQNMNASQRALANLLGLAQYRAGLAEQRGGGDTQSQLAFERLNLTGEQFNRQMDAYENAYSPFNTIFPAFLGMAGRIGAAAV